MENDPFSSLARSIINYLPNLAAGLALVVLGLAVGWFIKRIVFQICLILRIDRLFKSFSWGRDFSKADIRQAFFNIVGNVAFALVFLVFLNAALAAMHLIILSNLIERSVNIIPKLFVSLAIFAIGWLLARWVGVTVRRNLLKEGVPRATLIAGFSNAVVLLFFSAMALVELDIAREIVIIGFSAIIITLGVLAVVVVSVGGRELIKKTVSSLQDRER